MSLSFSHALPLIPPIDNTMTMEQCETEIKSLEKTHQESIVQFWDNIKNRNVTPDSSWNITQLDLYTLLKNSKPYSDFDEPDDSYVKNIWNNVTSKLNEDIKKEIQISNYVNLDLVGVMSNDNEIIVIHRYESAHLNNISEDDLFIAEDDGQNWYYQSSFYEPEGFHHSPYGVASLYIIGVIDSETMEWHPKPVDSAYLYKIKDFVSSTESLLERDALDQWQTRSLPSFPSGVESKLEELNMLRTWMVKQAFTTADEKIAIEQAIKPYEKNVNDLQQQIHTLKEALEKQEKVRNISKLEAMLKFHGFECGQTLTHSSNGKTGILSITDEWHPKLYIAGDDFESPSWSTTRDLEYQLRRKEWFVSVEESNNVERQRG